MKYKGTIQRNGNDASKGMDDIFEAQSQEEAEQIYSEYVLEYLEEDETLEINVRALDEEYTEMAVFENNGHRSFCDLDEIEPATLGDMLDADFSIDDCGLICVGENEDGEELYTSATDFDGEKTLAELKSIEIDWYRIKYWDGNNWQCDIFETYDTCKVIVHSLEDPSPAYYFNYELELEDGERVQYTKSNTSGSISPYYDEYIEE